MNLFKKAAFCYVAPLLSILGIASAPLDAQVCEPAPCCIDWCSLLVPALVGAAAGAATAAAIKNHGKRGKKGECGEIGESGREGERGPRGPEGRNPFNHDVGQSLQVYFTVSSISFTGTNSGQITPYISTPDGEIFLGQPINLVNTGALSPIVVAVGTPAFGSYVLGFEFPVIDSPVTFAYNIKITPTNGAPSTELAGSVVMPALSSESQFSLDYVFGPVGTVP